MGTETIMRSVDVKVLGTIQVVIRCSKCNEALIIKSAKSGEDVEEDRVYVDVDLHDCPQKECKRETCPLET